ncbi:MAG: FkbM family methyltransferase [Rhodobacter sp.]|nr:FkbM family methyltransferase [Rhodobacter sp.]
MGETEFFEYLVRRAPRTYSQLGQDLWVLSTLGHPRDGYFVEIGAYDGVNISNTVLLESLGWDGLLVEPNPAAFAALKSARTAKAIRRCVSAVDGETVEFKSVDTKPELSKVLTVASDVHDISGLRAHFQILSIPTISPKKMLLDAGAPKVIDYLSIDTEGSELEIAKAFPFEEYKVRLISVEHNFGEQRDEIFDLLSGHGFQRVLTSVSRFDDWYVNPSLIPDGTASTLEEEEECFSRLSAASDAPAPGRNVAPLLRRVANRLRNDARFEEAREVLREHLQRYPTDVSSLRDAAAIEAAAGNAAAAHAALRQAIDAAPHVFGAREDLAALHLQDRRPDQALEVVRPVIRNHPGRARAASMAARALAQLGRLKESADTAIRAGTKRALPEQFTVNLARRLQSDGAAGEAVELLRKAAGADALNERLNASLLDALIDYRSAGGTVGPPVPRGNDYEKRIAIAEEGRMCVEGIPKVSGAGEVVATAGARFQRMFDGTLVLEDSYYGTWMTQLIANLGGHHEPQEEKVFFETLEHLDGGFILELGAFWGFYSVAFLRRFGDGATAMMVEPDVRNLVVGLETVRANDVRAEVRLGIVPPVPAPLREQALNHGVTISPSPFRVQDYMAASGRDEITILHADIQGAETRLMGDIGELLARRAIRYLFVSTHGPEKQTAVLEAVRDAGYFLVAEHDGPESFSFDGLVVARAPDVTGPGFIDLPLRREEVEPAKKKSPARNIPGERQFQVIKLFGHGFWANVEHAVWQIVIAETLGRTPLVHWGKVGYYGNGRDETFTLYYEPLSDVTVEDISTLGFHPGYWNAGNIRNQAPAGADTLDIAHQRTQWLQRSFEMSNDTSRLNDALQSLERKSEAQAFVSMSYLHFEDIRPWLPTESPYKEMSIDAVRKHIYRKYFSLQAGVATEIEHRRTAAIPPGGPVAAVHSRATDKHELEGLEDRDNEHILAAARTWMQRSGGRLFLMTESSIERQKYVDAFGDRVLTQDCFRSDAPLTPNFKHPEASGYESGLSVLADTYIGAGCDYFIGSRASNVAKYLVAISDLTPDRIELVE